MKEVELKRFVGPFVNIPFNHYIQSPIGLVPKDGDKKTRLIFHLSYPRNSQTRKSVNANTPLELCKVHYCDFDQAIQRCIEEGKSCFIGKSDILAVFRNLGIMPEHWPYLVLKAKDPSDGKTYFFIDKCLPFGESISCAQFQSVSDCIAYLVWWRNGKKKVINYLDDFLFIALLKCLCDGQMNIFLLICKDINFPVSLDKTFWGTT